MCIGVGSRIRVGDSNPPEINSLFAVSMGYLTTRLWPLAARKFTALKIVSKIMSLRHAENASTAANFSPNILKDG